MNDFGSDRPQDGRAKEFDYDTIDIGYYDRIYRKCEGIQSKWHHLKFTHLRGYFRAPQYHLDIGCGPGTFIGTLDEAIESVGIDIALPQILYARANYGAPWRKFEVIERGRLPFDAGTFDVVTCIELVEHLPLDEALSLCVEARRVLKPDGLFVVTTPDYGGLWPALEWLVNRLGDVSYEDQHITHFTRKRLAGLLDEAGFDHRRVSRFQFLAPFVAALGWRLADRVARLEPGFLTSRLGFLLVGEARSTRTSQENP